MSLNPQQFPLFHGTAHPLEGDKILPGKEIGRSQWKDAGEIHGERSSDHAWASPDEPLAWNYARVASGHLDHTDPANRPRVHEVAPHPEMRRGSTNTFDETGGDEYYAPHFKTTGVVHDIKPGHQGTFPTINWQQFATSGDANHPDHPDMAEWNQQEVPNMRPRSHPTLPLGDIEVKQWDGKMARQSVDDAVRDRASLNDRPYNPVTPIYAMDEHRQKYPHGVVTR
jgi:hypothetical protein